MLWRAMMMAGNQIPKFAVFQQVITMLACVPMFFRYAVYITDTLRSSA